MYPTLPINCMIETQYDYDPEDVDLGPSPDQTLMAHIHEIDGLDVEVS
jgi:hypothetical protein